MMSVEMSRVLGDILELEWTMFVAVKSDRPASCQSAPDKFRAIRSAIFRQWSADMLSCYLQQLSLAALEGRNLLAEKYARMDNLIAPLSTSPYLDEIVSCSEKWQAEIEQHYPGLYRRCCRTLEPTGDGRNFSVYLRCELETYGDAAIALYHEMVTSAVAENKNLALDSLRLLLAESGYADLDLAEKELAGICPTEVKKGA